MDLRRLLLPVVLAVALNPPTAHAQSILDRVVGTDRERPLVITELKGHTVGRLAGAVGVPMGLEAASVALVQTWTVAATGRTLREVANAIVAADPRYDWREDNGVLVFRPRAAWDGATSALDARVAAAQFEDIEAADALQVISRLFGVNQPPGVGPGDTRRFSVDVPAGSTRLEALNAIVRAHGTLAWVLERAGGRAAGADFPLSVSLFIGASGTGVGIPRAAAVRGSPLSGSAIPRARPARGDQVPLLDRIVGPRRSGELLRLNGISGISVSRLAAAVGVPMGVQMLSPDLPPVVYPGFEGYAMTGMPLRTALEMLASLDARYEWREMDGVIVFRPVTAWNDTNDALFRLVPNVQLHDVPSSKAISVLVSLLGAPGSGNTFPDTRVVSVDVPQGSVLELLNAIARAHRELSWEWTELSAAEQRVRGGRRHLTCWLFGASGLGWTLP